MILDTSSTRVDEQAGRARTLREAEWCDAGDLVRRIEAGDPAAEAELVVKYQRGIRTMVTRASRDRSSVDDLCQDVMRVAIEKIRAGAVREPERLSGFIAGLARTRVIDHFRRIDARGAHDAQALVLPSVQAANPLERVLEIERAQIVRTLLRELDSDRDRQVLFRYYLADEEKARICRDLNLTPLHFNRVLFRARERFRDLLRRSMPARGLNRGAG